MLGMCDYYRSKLHAGSGLELHVKVRDDEHLLSFDQFFVSIIMYGKRRN